VLERPVPPKPIPRVPKTLFTKLNVEVAETTPSAFVRKKPEGALLIVRLVVVALVVVEFVAVKPTMLAIEVLSVLMMPFVKLAIGEKREVEVALPRVAFPETETFVVEAFRTVSVLVEVAKVKLDEAAKEPYPLKLTCELAPATVLPDPP
jgi:hypothetical protein